MEGRTIIGEAGEGARLDSLLAERMPEVSRSRWAAAARAGRVRVNGEPVKPNRRLKVGDVLEWSLEEASIGAGPIPEEMELDPLYEDAALIVLAKPPGRVVHPAPGHPSGTLLHGLLFRYPELARVERAGIVHRLDKDTSGVLAVARTEAAREALKLQFKERETRKEYLALTWGRPAPTGRIETFLGRHPARRKKRAVLGEGEEGARFALTTYRIEEAFSETTLLRVRIETGRTHQIRVHMAHIGHPIVGDVVYGRSRKGRLPAPGRQMLHAVRLDLNHPVSGKRLSFEAPLPEDMREVLERLREADERRDAR